jgi:hypothetical protein
MKLVCLVLATATLLPVTSQAKWKPQYASAPQEVQDWYKSRKLTDAAAKRFAFKSCCDGSDKVETQFRVDKATGDDKWYYQKDGQWVEVPPDVIWWDEHSDWGSCAVCLGRQADLFLSSEKRAVMGTRSGPVQSLPDRHTAALPFTLGGGTFSHPGTFCS